MKKIFAILLMIPLFLACSSDSDKFEDKLSFIQCFAKSDDPKVLGYEVYIYKGDISDYEYIHPRIGTIAPPLAKDLNGNTVFPLNLSDYEMKGDNKDEYSGYWVNSFFPKSYQIPQDGRYTIQFTVSISLKGRYTCTKSFDINKNSIIRLKFDNIIDYDKKDVSGDWQVVDATQNNYRELIDFK